MKTAPKNVLTKTDAEALKFSIEADDKLFELEHKKSVRALETEYKQKALKAKLAKLDSEARRTEYEAKIAELSYNVHKREEDKLLTNDLYNNTYRFVQEIDETSVALCMQMLSRWSRLKPKCDIEIVFCCPGGSMVDGFALFDFIEDLKRKGHKITTKSIGYAASMASVLLQAGTERVMGSKSWLLIHEASFNAQGKTGVIDDAVGWVKKMADNTADIFAERAAEKTGKSTKTIKNFIKKNWNRKDWWLSANEALEYGFCDRIE